MAKQAPKKYKYTSEVERNELFAICTTLNVFQFCMLLNNLFSIDLQGCKPVEMKIDERELSLHRYSAKSQSSLLTISVVENKIGEGCLIDFFKNISFFVKISPIVVESQVTDFQSVLNSRNEFQFVQKIEISNLSSAQQPKMLKFIQYL